MDDLIREPALESDDLGTRRFEHDPRHGDVERLDLIPSLATAGAEQAIRARAARLAQAITAPVAPVHRIDREAGRLTVTGGVTQGLSLSEILSLGQRPNVGPWPALPLVAGVVRAVAALHDHAPSVSHGAITPARLILTREGSFVLRDAVYGAALEGLLWNRERYWRHFGLALPAGVGVLRFDRRADTTQMGVAILAVLLQRTLREDDYPVRTDALAEEATQGVDDGRADLRVWLQQTLQLHPRASFASAVEACAAFDTHAVKLATPRMRAQLVQRLVGPGPNR